MQNDQSNTFTLNSDSKDSLKIQEYLKSQLDDANQKLDVLEKEIAELEQGSTND